MRIAFIEPCAKYAVGSIGAFYIKTILREMGYIVDTMTRPRSGYDIECFSIHHVRDFLKFAAMPKRAPIRIIGGHPMASNPKPLIPFSDIICIGEGESWIKKYFSMIEKGEYDKLKTTDGIIVCKDWEQGSKIKAVFEKGMPENPPYLNRVGTLSAAWYIEIARGCPWRCHYCGLGNLSPFRQLRFTEFKKIIDQIDFSKCRKTNLFAPDEASVVDVKQMREYIKEKTGTIAPFSSVRIESFTKREMEFPHNTLIRVGLDGLTEKTRFRVCKKITDNALVEYFRRLIDKGHVTFKVFMIFSYPWDTIEDFAEWEQLMDRILRLDLRKNVSLRIKWTAFIPQPGTPLENEKPTFNFDIERKIHFWHAQYKRPNINPGWYIDCDGVSSFLTHKKECAMTSGDEFSLFGLDKKLRPIINC